MLQREIVRFRASDKLPNPLEVDYWVDTSSNYYGGCIRYYRNDTDTWEMLDINDKQALQLLDYINNALDLIELYINDSITEIRNELSDFEDTQREEVNKLWEYINQNIESINNQILSIRNDIAGINNNFTSLQQLITNIAQDVTELSAAVDTKLTDLKEYVDELIANLKDYVDDLVINLTGLINQEATDRANAINALRTELKNYIDGLIGDAATNLSELEDKINKHAARRDNPHVVTRDQLSLATSDNVVFNKVSAPSGFFKE